MQATKTTNIIALDVGDKRVGIASANSLARLPSPLTTLNRGESFWDKLQDVIKTEEPELIVVGLPRNLNGQETAQSDTIRQFVEELKEHTDTPIDWQDETLSSRQAEQELVTRGKPFAKGDIDALAATVILDDYLAANN